MTNSNQTPPSPKRLRLASTALVIAISQLSPAAFADALTWNNTTTDFADAANWGGAAPATTDSAIFAAATTAIPSLAADRSILGIDFTAAAGGSTLTSAPGVTLTLGANGIDATGQLTLSTNTVSVANLKIGATQTWTLFSNTNNATGATNPTTFSVSSNIALNSQNLTIISNRNGTTGNVGVVNLSGNITGATGANGLMFNGGSPFRNTVNLTGANTYTGTTTITNVTVTANSLADTGTSALGFGDLTLGTLNTNSGLILTFQNLASDGTTNRLVNTSSIAGSGVVINNNDADNTVAFNNTGNLDTNAGSTSTLLFILGGTNTGSNVFAQVINERIGTGATNLTKSGAGKWVLTGANTYGGLTTVSGGTLLINGNQSTATGAVSVASTATLGGAGTIGGATTIASGAFLAPGDSPGLLTFASSLTLANGSFTTMELAGNGGVAGVDFDRIAVTGAITFGGSLNIVSFASYDINQVASYDLFDFGSSSGDFSGVSVAATALTNTGGGIWTGDSGTGVTYTFNQADGTFSVAASAVPEPATYATLAGLGILGFAVYRRRRA